MGSDQTDENDCSPHTVTLSDFYIGQFEVSQGFWTKIMNENPSEYQDVDDINNFPVENVSFEEVQVFINRLNNKTGKSFSLPTEAQWEFAARGGTQSKGTNFAGSQYPNNIWFYKNNPVMLKFPPSVNELGIYQMSGNVAEWCLDYYNRMFYSQSNKSKNPLNTKANNSRVVRGGSFDDTDPEYVTVYYRNSGNDATGYIGFRLVVNL
jgi:formylglycine-generating enzyme required for sulfatase activity